MFYNPNSLQKVKEALAWAYRSGYYMAEEAANELASVTGERVVKVDLGTYGDTIGFEPVADSSEMAEDEPLAHGPHCASRFHGAAPCDCGAAQEQWPDESMDGDHASALESVYGPND